MLGNDSAAKKKVTDASNRLDNGTIMVAYHAPIDGQSDNVGVIEEAGQAPSDGVQDNSDFQDSTTSTLNDLGAQNINFSDVELGDDSAEKATYSIPESGARTIYEAQLYVPVTVDLYVVTVAAGSPERVSEITGEIVQSWSTK